jgi:hypothetical protein
LKCMFDLEIVFVFEIVFGKEGGEIFGGWGIVLLGLYLSGSKIKLDLFEFSVS